MFISGICLLNIILEKSVLGFLNPRKPNQQPWRSIKVRVREIRAFQGKDQISLIRSGKAQTIELDDAANL